MPRLVRPLLAVASLVCAAALAGCVQIVAQNETQREAIGDVEVTTTVCLSQLANVQGAKCPDTGSNSGQDAGNGDAQLLVAYRVPSDAVAPDTVAATYSAGDSGSTTLVRSDSYSSEMNAKAPAVAGQEWVGYISPTVVQGRQTPDAQAQIVADFGLPRSADGSPYRGPFTYRVVVGGRAPAADPGRPVACADDVTTSTSPNDPTVCVDAPTKYGPMVPAGKSNEEAFLDDDRALATKDLGVASGASVTAAPGSAVTVPFTISSVNLAGSPAFNLSATTTVLGASAIPAQSTFAPQAGDSTVGVTLNVPAGTPPGSYDVSLSASLGGQTRTGHARVTVAAPSGGSTGSTAPHRPALTLAVPRQKLGRALAHGLKVKVGCDEACAVRVRLGKLGAGRARLSSAGKKVVTARFTRTARRALAHKRSVTITVRATATARALSATRTKKRTLTR